MINSSCYRVDFPRPKPMCVRATISKDKLVNIQNTIKKCIATQAISDLNKIFDEGALISRMCCKVKKKFRGEKLFRRLKQITVSIKKLHQINISEVMLNLLSTFENGMPSKQAGLWTGTRILTVILLVDHLQQFCEGVAQLIVKVFQNGQCWLEMNIALAMVSRVWILTKSLNRSFSRSYKLFTPLVSQLKVAESKWFKIFELPNMPKDDLEKTSGGESEEELVEQPGSVMSRKPEPDKPVVKKRKRPGKQIRMLQEKQKFKKKKREETKNSLIVVT